MELIIISASECPRGVLETSVGGQVGVQVRTRGQPYETRSSSDYSMGYACLAGVRLAFGCGQAGMRLG